jgi:hypothetical protein
VDFSRDVRPILSGQCFKCHGIDDKARKGGLRLDVREAALKPAESGKGLILRCYNDTAEPVRGAWVVGGAFASASRCRLDETITGKLSIQRGRVAFEAGPREIVTILLRQAGR